MTTRNDLQFSYYIITETGWCNNNWTINEAKNDAMKTKPVKTIVFFNQVKLYLSTNVINLQIFDR